jgi:hypothetical protein
MMHGILSEIIQQTFQVDVGKHSDHGMFVRFRGMDEDSLDLLIWGKMNYVGVWVRSIVQRRAIPHEGGGWYSLAYHDSCWRIDGVERFCTSLSIERNAKYFSLDTFGIPTQHWFQKVFISETFGKELMDIVSERQAGRLKPSQMLVDMEFVRQH